MQMSNKILRDFFYGSLSPSEKRIDHDSEYGKAAAELADAEETLRKMLAGEALTALDTMVTLQCTITSLTAEGYFIDGLRTGFRLAVAALDDGEPDFLRSMTKS